MTETLTFHDVLMRLCLDKNQLNSAHFHDLVKLLNHFKMMWYVKGSFFVGFFVLTVYVYLSASITDILKLQINSENILLCTQNVPIKHHLAYSCKAHCLQRKFSLSAFIFVFKFMEMRKRSKDLGTSIKQGLYVNLRWLGMKHQKWRRSWSKCSV